MEFVAPERAEPTIGSIGPAASRDCGVANKPRLLAQTIEEPAKEITIGVPAKAYNDIPD